MTWRERFEALAAKLAADPRVELRAFHLFPPAADTAGLPAGLAGLYAETNGVQLAWVDRSHPGYDPSAPGWTDAPAPWSAADDEPGWTGAIWLLPAARVRAEGVLDPLDGGIRLSGDGLVRPDGTRGSLEDVLGGLLAAHGRRDGVTALFPDEEEGVERGFALWVSVIDVRRMATEDASWGWVDRGLDAEQIARKWRDAEEIVEVELEVPSLPPALVPGAAGDALIRQLLTPWGSPAAFVATVDLTERPRWVVAFAAASDDPTDDTAVHPELVPPVATPPIDEDAATPGFQYAATIRPIGADWLPRVTPSPVHLRRRWSAQVYPDGRTYALAASPDGSEVAAISEAGEVLLWSVDGAAVPLEVQRAAESFSELGFGLDGRLAVWDGNLVTRWESDGSAAGFVHHAMAGVEGFDVDDKEFALWANRPVFLDIRGDHHGTIDAIGEDLVSRSALSSSGHELVLGTEGGRVALYTLDPLEQKWLVPTDLGEIRSIALLPGGGRAAVGGREAIAVFDDKGHELRRLPAHEGLVAALGWVGGGRYLASAGADRALRLWCARCGALLIEHVLPTAPTALVASRDGRWLAVATPNRVTVFDVLPGDLP